MVRSFLWTAVATLGLSLPAAAPAALPAAPVSIEHARLLGATHLDGQLFHVQGVEVDGDNVLVTSADRKHHRGYIHEFDRTTGKFLRRLELTDGLRFHPGGISIAGRSIWIPVSEPRARSSAVLVEIDADTFAIRRRIAVADHLGCVAATSQRLIAGNWNSEKLYVFDLASESAPQAHANPTLTRYQDMKFVGGELVASGQLGGHKGAIDWIDPASMKLVRSLHAGTLGRPWPFSHPRAYTAEGMALQGRQLYLLPEDGPSRLFHFELDN
ncbi:MAG: hypothetical protein KGN34_01180 [Sphingomonadales bacterium]|nr:hypothetical protein [Sphingomonadales bacterium]